MRQAFPAFIKDVAWNDAKPHGEMSPDSLNALGFLDSLDKTLLDGRLGW
ncbi:MULTISPECIES: hypothetical protein [Halomonadaceae]|nr:MULTISPECIES: hypothetical protein [Halomonas]MDI4636130.1 hypothetical protein [Halomonas sp. BMC7]NUJ60496.1 hypothetical protein [Halomonas taeanensis]